ncbi:MAG TPA: hypothetical protein PL048_17820 [Leptospiraceae bacterium]|nr:hypothetical protein [Leptospiraceae bacterium]
MPELGADFPKDFFNGSIHIDFSEGQNSRTGLVHWGVPILKIYGEKITGKR